MSIRRHTHGRNRAMLCAFRRQLSPEPISEVPTRSAAGSSRGLQIRLRGRIRRRKNVMMANSELRAPLFGRKLGGSSFWLAMDDPLILFCSVPASSVCRRAREMLSIEYTATYLSEVLGEVEEESAALSLSTRISIL